MCECSILRLTSLLLTLAIVFAHSGIPAFAQTSVSEPVAASAVETAVPGEPGLVQGQTSENAASSTKNQQPFDGETLHRTLLSSISTPVNNPAAVVASTSGQPNGSNFHPGPWGKFFLGLLICSAVATSIAVPIACGVVHRRHHHHHNVNNGTQQLILYNYLNAPKPVPVQPDPPRPPSPVPPPPPPPPP